MSETLGQLLERLHYGMISFDQLASWYYERGIEQETMKSEIARLTDEVEELNNELTLKRLAHEGEEAALRARAEQAEAQVGRLAEVKFVRHIESHLKGDQVVMCKICGKTIFEIMEAK